jgi:hypothetical protein
MDSFWDFFWWMIAAYFWVVVVWAFISIFADIFRRRDLSGAAKAGWLFLLIVLPVLGLIIYMIARPAMTEQDKEMLDEMEHTRRRMSGVSDADEIERLSRLADEGKISRDEFETLKGRVVA